MDKSEKTHENQQFKYVTWSSSLEEIRYYKKGKNDSIYEISNKLPGKSILKNKEILEKSGKDESNTNNCLDSEFVETKKDEPGNKVILSKKQLRKLKKRERNKAKGYLRCQSK